MKPHELNSKSAGRSQGRLIRVKGTVQGVGFRPTVYVEAIKLSVTGHILNDGEGVLIKAFGEESVLDAFIAAIKDNCPPLGHIDSIDWCSVPDSEMAAEANLPDSFEIVESVSTSARTAIAADARTCAACLEDTLSPFSRRYRYPFTNCTHCGPRLSIIKGIPYDRPNTSMAPFALCRDCLAEYKDPLDRRFHAQPNACYVCGPKVKLVRTDGHAFSREAYTQMDDVDAVAGLILKGQIVAVKGIGGFHIACDATNEQVVARLRERKKRFAKPFALMAKNIGIIERYCYVSEQELELLNSVASPVVLLDIKDSGDLSLQIAPGQNTLGFMLPYTPLHHLMLRRIDKPIVLTSANLSDEPQCIDNDDALKRLSGIADFVLLHDRDIINRIDDSVARVVQGQTVIVRRARGYAPAPTELPPGFERTCEVLALGGELKNTFCLIKDDKAVLSQHMGDLEDAATYQDYLKNIELYRRLFQSEPKVIAIDQHPEYLSSKLGRKIVQDAGTDSLLKLEPVQHHHAHVAACMAEHKRPLSAAKVLGVALDGLGYGEGQLWGGEFLLCDYLGYERLATFKPVAMPGGSMAMREPWRNTYAHIMAEMGWHRYLLDYEELELTAFFKAKNLSTFEAMLKNGVNSPLASSCGRLFDAVAAAIGICRESASYEGQAAIELEAIACKEELESTDEFLIYPFTIPRLQSGLPYIEPIGMWQALLGDLVLGTPAPVISARFHKGLARVLAHMVKKLSIVEDSPRFDTVVLTGGVFQNRLLLQLTRERLQVHGFNVLTPARIPANDGGIALGQALIASAKSLERE